MPKVGWFSTDWVFERHMGGLRATFGGTFHYRMNLPALELAKHGWECVLSWEVTPADDGHLRVKGVDGVWHDDCDIVVFQRWMHTNGADIARRAIAAGQTIVQDLDDWFWDLPESNVAAQATARATSPIHNRDNYRRMIAASSAVICSTETIARRVERLGPPAFVCRNAIDIDRWEPHDPGEGGMVGWVGGVAWRGNDLHLLNGVLGPYLEKYGLPFYHGGHDRGREPAWRQLGLDRSKTRAVVAPLVPLDRYPRLWDPVNLAIIPIEGSVFGRAKSWLKGLEAAACGVPFIASRLPEYERLGCGRLARNANEWRRHLEALTDPAVRRAEGAANRRRAEELSIGRQWPKWDLVFSHLAAGSELCTTA